MKSYRLDTGPVHLLRLEAGEDIVDTFTAFAADRGITTAWFSYLGAVTTAALRYYDQGARAYRDFVVDRHLEVLSGVGNVTMLDGAPFVHTHAAFADDTGAAWGGHLDRGCRVFSLEVRLQELRGDGPVRSHDEMTGLKLWGGDCRRDPAGGGSL